MHGKPYGPRALPTHIIAPIKTNNNLKYGEMFSNSYLLTYLLHRNKTTQYMAILGYMAIYIWQYMAIQIFHEISQKLNSWLVHINNNN
jgi:hypothetical protein